MGRRRNNPHDSRDYADWINAAYDDLRAAELLQSDSTLNNATAFHCQQCVEKSLKCYLLFRTRQTVDGHNLTWLCRRASSIDRRFSEWLDESATLNRYYIETRYPTDIPTEISDQMTGRLVAMSHEIFDFVVDDLDCADELDQEYVY
jgi:HEPN domain-containing protein